MTCAFAKCRQCAVSNDVNFYTEACPRCLAPRMELCFVVDKSIVRHAKLKGRPVPRSERVHKERADAVRAAMKGRPCQTLQMTK